MALIEQAPEGIEIGVGKSAGGSHHPVVLGHHVAAERVVHYELERRVSQCRKTEPGGQLFARVPPVGVGALVEAARDTGIGRREPRATRQRQGVSASDLQSIRSAEPTRPSIEQADP